MFCTDEETKRALNALMVAAQSDERPLVLWIGAGASAWAGYPLWQQLAAEMHSIFSREVAAYDKAVSSQLLAAGAYPSVFEHIRSADQGRYFSILARCFGPRPEFGVYQRFIKILNRLPNVPILTTNVDEFVERNLPDRVTVQHSDIERVPLLLQARTTFIAKLHGSVSAVETMVFTQNDYKAIQRPEYLNALTDAFSNTTVLFIGYGLRDDYILQLLQASATHRPIFGIGPHFIITAEDRIDLPSLVYRIRYVPEVADHRDSLQVLEALVDGRARSSTHVEEPNHRQENTKESIYFIADIMPPGTWNTSQSVMIRAPSEATAHEMLVGEGYVVGEVELHDYSALHDVVVGLICFDKVCLSLENLERIHNLLGSEAFWLFIRNGCLRIVIPPSDPVVIFQDQQAAVGSLAAINVGSVVRNDPIMSTAERIRRQIRPVPGKEKEAEDLFELLESTALDGADPNVSETLPQRTIAALMNPSVRQLIGLSGGTPTGSIPRWLAFPVIRLARVIRSGLICQRIAAASTRMIWGSEKLASIAFSASDSTEWAEDAASYVLSGRYNSNLGEIVQKRPSILLEILRFRETPPGQALRREVIDRLAANDGQQINVVINAGLQQAIPISILERARDQLSGLFIRRSGDSTISPAVWGDLRNSDARIAGWRKRSFATFLEEINRRGLSPYDLCPCGSGEKLKFCCQRALA
ncbi:MAG: SIR2 family protein [Steroidobacteraceae bacterium]